MKIDKRATLLKNAEELFSEKGYLETTVEDITKKSKCAKGTFYNYFDTKKSLLLSLLDIKLGRYIIDYKYDLETKSLEEILIKDTEFFIKTSFDNLAFFNLFFNLVSKNMLDEEIKEKHEKYFTIQMSRLVELFNKIEELNGTKMRYPDRKMEIASTFNITRMLYIQKNLICMRSAEDLKKIDVRKEAEFIVDMFMNGAIKN